MDKRLRDVVDYLDEDELKKIKRDLEEGGFHLRKFVENKIKEREKLHQTICKVCANELDPYSTSNYTLIFGPDDFKKKASFCGIDCLEHFLNNLKEIKKESLRWQKQE